MLLIKKRLSDNLKK